MFPNKTKLLQVLEIIAELCFFIFFWLLCCKMSFLLVDSQLLIFFLNGILSFVSGLDIFRSKSGSIFSFTSFYLVLLKKSCRSRSVTVTEAEPISCFMDSPVTAYSSDFLNLTFSSSFFSVIFAVKILFLSTGKSL